MTAGFRAAPGEAPSHKFEPKLEGAEQPVGLICRDPAFLRAEGQREHTTETCQIDKSKGVAHRQSNFHPLRAHRSPPAVYAGLRRRRGSMKGGGRHKHPESSGGNMDYNGVGTGVKLMPPVSEPGALLFTGDHGGGHNAPLVAGRAARHHPPSAGRAGEPPMQVYRPI